MKNMPSEIVIRAISKLFEETFRGTGPTWGYVLNRGDLGFTGEFSKLSVEQATRKPIPGPATAAAHANQILYHLQLCNRAMRGERAFETADWRGSWRIQVETEDQWHDLPERMGKEAAEWLATLEAQPQREWDDVSLTGTMATVVHLGYHVGALRQLAALL